MTRADRHRPINVSAGHAGRSWGALTHAAFVVLLAACLARLTTVDVLREAWSAVPGGDAGARGPGPATGLALDLLAAVPALLVLARRAVDPGYRLARRRSHWLLLALTLWMAASAAWSADAFAAVVGTAHFAAGACLLWAASQLVRSWDRLRVVAAVALGMLLALAVHTAVYRFVDLANTRQFWVEHREQFLHDRGWAADSFAAKQFELKLTTGEQSASFNSANTLAATAVLLTFAAAAVGARRAAEDDPRWAALSAVAVAAGAWVLLVARSKTALATPVLGAGALAAWWAFGDRLRRHATAAYAAGVAAVGLGLLAVVGHGVAHHGLFAGHFSNSLDFRWKYWTASAGVFRDHPLAGVGWGNFGQSYLAHRVPEAAEEIKDPHDFLVRFATELGVVGLLLVVGWLLRLAWELTRPSDAPFAADRPPAVMTIAWVAVLGIGVGIVATVDPSAGVIDTIYLQMRPLLLLTVVLLGGIAAAMRTPQDRGVDDRAVPWVANALLVGLGLFLLHNLIDFGWFEPGAGFAFMTLAGARLGMSPAADDRRSRPWSVGVLAAAAVAWAGALLGVMVPVALASAQASTGDEIVRSASPKDPAAVAAAYRRAAVEYAGAAGWVPYDGDLLLRAARAAAMGGDGARARSLAAEALRVDPRLIDAHLLDADLRLAAKDGPGVRAAFDAAIGLNPNDVPIRQHYAEALAQLGDAPAAAAQYRAALAANAALPPDEPRRLSAAQVAEFQRHAGG